MKTLELNQMEKLEGGECSNDGSHVVAALSLYYAVALASGLIGWAMVGLSLAGAYYTSKDCAVK